MLVYIKCKQAFNNYFTIVHTSISVTPRFEKLKYGIRRALNDSLMLFLR